MVKRPDADILRRNEANIRLQLSIALENVGDTSAALKHAQTAFTIRENWRRTIRKITIFKSLCRALNCF
jgi:hypothetical protein